MSPTPSPFAAALRALLDDTGLFDRAEWRVYLHVPAGAIDRWLSDEALPRPHDLSMIVLGLEQSSGVPPGPLAVYAAMAARRATEVSPHGARMLPTVAEYAGRPVVSELASTLAKLEPDGQARLLLHLFPA